MDTANPRAWSSLPSAALYVQCIVLATVIYNPVAALTAHKLGMENSWLWLRPFCTPDAGMRVRRGASGR